MPRFEPKSFSYFLQRMANRVVARSALTDLEEGGVLHTILSAAARELDDQSFQMVNLQRIWDIDTATGEDLDDRALDFNPDKLERTGASFATGLVEFARTGTTGTITVPAGTIVKVSGGGPEYATIASVQILNGFTTSTTVGILAIVAGSAGVVDPGAINQLVAVTGVETVTNPAVTLPGQDGETDAEFRSRMKAFLRSLPRGTPDALKFSVLSTFLDTFGRIVTVEVIELTGADLGQVLIYVDDGSGTIEVTATNFGTPEVVVASAIGGEVRLFLSNIPLKLATAVNIEKNAVTIVEGVDYTLNRASGQITLTTALIATDSIDAEYTWHTGLIQEAQKIVDGDATDRTNYPGYRAAGTQVFVIAPTVLQQIVVGAIIIEPPSIGEAADIRAAVSSAINRYINGLGINGDVILTELIFHAQSVEGVADVEFSTPAANVIMGEGELARVIAANIDLT